LVLEIDADRLRVLVKELADGRDLVVRFAGAMSIEEEGMAVERFERTGGPAPYQSAKG